MIALLVLSSFAAVMIAQDAPPRIDPKDAKKFRGKVVTICGRIVTVACPLGAGVTIRFAPQASAIEVVVPQSVRSSLGSRLEEQFLLQGVCATGLLSKGEKAEQLTVENPSNLSVERRFAVPPLASDAHWPCEPTVTPPKPVKVVDPVHTPASFGKQGTVMIQLVVERDGVPGSMRVVMSAGPDLDQQALAAARQWRFEPGTFMEEPAAIVVTIEIRFRFS